MLVGGVALFLSIVAGGEMARRAAAPPKPADAGGIFALDFIAFYTGGAFVMDGRQAELFDMRAVQRYQQQLAAANGADLGTAVGPWWNPPFYAWVFAPLSRLPFGVASAVWVTFNVACAGAACWVLARMLPPNLGWKTYALVPAMVLLSTPFIHAITHGQNACTSLLIVTMAVAAWRAEKALLAGLIAGLMFYKPQHAVVLGGMLTLSLGWRALAGLAITGTSLLLITLLTLPGALGPFLHQMPLNVRHVQEQTVYLWERHATLLAFWRLAVQGPAAGPPGVAVQLLVALCTGAVAVVLLRLTALNRWINPFDAADRKSPAHRDRLIIATFIATPLLMPFYFDYDLLMLAVPGVLLANRKLTTGRLIDGGVADRALLIVAPVAYAWLMLNADIAERLGFNGIVPLLGGLLALVAVQRVPKAAAERAHVPHDAPAEPPLARAA